MKVKADCLKIFCLIFIGSFLILSGCAGREARAPMEMGQDVAKKDINRENVTGSKGGEVIIEYVNDHAALLDWKNCVPGEKYNAGDGRQVIFGGRTICKSTRVGIVSGEDGNLYVLARLDVVKDVLLKVIPGKSGQKPMKLKGNLIGTLADGRVIIRKQYTRIIGALGDEPIDAFLNQTSEKYYEVVDENAKPLKTLFKATFKGQEIRYTLKGLKVKKDGSFDIDAVIVLKPGETIREIRTK